MRPKYQEHFRRLENVPSGHVVVAAISDIQSDACTIHHGILNDDPRIAIRELESEYPWIKSTVSTTSYDAIADALYDGAAVITPGFRLKSNIRDKFGFCDVTAIKGSHFYRGFTDCWQRPGLLCQQSDVSLPKGNACLKTPAGTSLKLSPGSYFVDAEVIDDILQGETMLVIRI